MVVHAGNESSLETEVEDGEFSASLGYITNPVSKERDY